jgi:hypothetical protein
MSNQGDMMATVITRSGSAGDTDYNGEWHRLFDAEEIAEGTFNGRMLDWLNAELVRLEASGAPYADLPGAMQAYAEALGFYNWSSMNAIDSGE